MKLKRLLLAVPRAGAMLALTPMERSLLSRAAGAAPKAIFIVGPPRSGTTLLYEAMVTRFQFSYFSNIAHRLHKTPAAATQLGSRAVRNWRGEFQSDYGHIAGWGSPNEGGWIWKRWIPEEHSLNESHAVNRDIETMRATVGAVANILEAPFLNKNVMHSVHMRLLDAVYPGCLFIECCRDAAATARSIVKARFDEFGEEGAHQWLSVRPDGWEDFELETPAVQAMAQVMLTHRAIHADAERVGPGRLHSVSYEALCESPETIMSSIRGFLAAHGVTPADRYELPARFATSKGAKLGDQISRDVARAQEQWREYEGASTMSRGVVAAQ